jgi:hypothetical protein
MSRYRRFTLAARIARGRACVLKRSIFAWAEDAGGGRQAHIAEAQDFFLTAELGAEEAAIADKICSKSASALKFLE